MQQSLEWGSLVKLLGESLENVLGIPKGILERIPGGTSAGISEEILGDIPAEISGETPAWTSWGILTRFSGKIYTRISVEIPAQISEANRKEFQQESLQKSL